MHQFGSRLDLRAGPEHDADPQRRAFRGRLGGGPAGSAAPSPGGSAAPAESGATAGGDIIKLVAQQIEFDQTTLSAPAGKPFNIEFLNDDAGVPHDVWIKDGTGADVFKGDVFPGVATKNYAVPALTAGQYTFFCTVHSNMTGTLTAG